MKKKHKDEAGKKEKEKKTIKQIEKQKNHRAYQENELRILKKKKSELASKCDAVVNTVQEIKKPMQA